MATTRGSTRRNKAKPQNRRRKIKRKPSRSSNGEAALTKSNKKKKTSKLGGADDDLLREEFDLLRKQLYARRHCTEWIGADGKKLRIFGAVRGNCDTDFLTIRYDKKSFSILDRDHTRIKNNSSILESLPMDISQVWGGCLLYREKNELQGRPPFPLRKEIPLLDASAPPLLWRVPDLCTSSTETDASVSDLPSLSLQYNGFQLEFTVGKKSVDGIPNVLHNVFLAITSLPGGQPGETAPKFSLQPGEVLDMGVHAPLTSEDEIPHHVMMVRSVLQSFWCDSYSVMNTSMRGDEDTYYDITHGLGELSPQARKSIFPFVNERRNTVENARSEIHLLQDPQGAYHYALGHREDGGKKVPAFEQVADGSKQEVFVNYGAEYDLVRLRHDSDRGLQRKQQLDEDEREKLELIYEFTEQEVKDGMRCVYNYATTNAMQKVKTQLGDMQVDRHDIRERVLAVVVLLQTRSEHLRRVPPTEDNSDADPDHERLSTSDWNTIDREMKLVVEELRPDLSPSTLLSTLSKEAANDSILGMACTIVGGDGDDGDES